MIDRGDSHRILIGLRATYEHYVWEELKKEWREEHPYNSTTEQSMYNYCFKQFEEIEAKRKDLRREKDIL